MHALTPGLLWWSFEAIATSRGCTTTLLLSWLVVLFRCSFTASITTTLHDCNGRTLHEKRHCWKIHAIVMDGGAMTTLTLSQAVYQFKAVEEQARDLLESTKQVFENVQTARGLRKQKSQQLNGTEKTWIDGVLTNMDKTLDNVRTLIEPARVDMQTNFGNVGFVNRSLFVLRDSPKVQTNLARLTIASGSLDNVLGILFSRQVQPQLPITPQTLSPQNSVHSAPPQWQPRMERIHSQDALSTISRFSDPPSYPSPAPSQPPASPRPFSGAPLVLQESPQRLSSTASVPRPYSRTISENVIELADTSSQISHDRRQSSTTSSSGQTPQSLSHPGLGIRTYEPPATTLDAEKIPVVQVSEQRPRPTAATERAISQQYQQFRHNRHEPLHSISSHTTHAPRDRDEYAPEPLFTQRPPVRHSQQVIPPQQQQQQGFYPPNHHHVQGPDRQGPPDFVLPRKPLMRESQQYPPEPVYPQSPPVRASQQYPPEVVVQPRNENYMHVPEVPQHLRSRISVSSMSTSSPTETQRVDKHVTGSSMSQMSFSSKASGGGGGRRRAWLAYQATR